MDKRTLEEYTPSSDTSRQRISRFGALLLRAEFRCFGEAAGELCAAEWEAADP